MTAGASSDNYATPDNLRARIALHQFATRPGYLEWLFNLETPAGNDQGRILDVGCGPAGMWVGNRDRIADDWALTLVDSSAGMIDAARGALGDRVDYAISDVQNLPLDDASVDIVLANHMLYHVTDRGKAFEEISRVLRPGGRFHCSTNGRGHLSQLQALAPDSLRLSSHSEVFGLETGPPQLEPYFTEIRVDRFENTLRVPRAEPVIAYIRSSERYTSGTDLETARERVNTAIAADGVFMIDARPGVISSRKLSAPDSSRRLYH